MGLSSGLIFGTVCWSSELTLMTSFKQISRFEERTRFNKQNQSGVKRFSKRILQDEDWDEDNDEEIVDRFQSKKQVSEEYSNDRRFKDRGIVISNADMVRRLIDRSNHPGFFNNDYAVIRRLVATTLQYSGHRVTAPKVIDTITEKIREYICHPSIWGSIINSYAGASEVKKPSIRDRHEVIKEVNVFGGRWNHKW